jgi:uncharacterized protein
LATEVPGDKTLPAPDPAQRQVIQSYGPGRFKVSEVEWSGPVLVSAEASFAWAVQGAAELAPDNLGPLLAVRPSLEILIVGCGARAVVIAPEIRAALRGAGLGLEVMDTGAACRTYNVLLAEGRRVGAALVPVS